MSTDDVLAWFDQAIFDRRRHVGSPAYTMQDGKIDYGDLVADPTSPHKFIIRSGSLHTEREALALAKDLVEWATATAQRS